MPMPPGQPLEVRYTEPKFTATIKVRVWRTVHRANANGYFDDRPVRDGEELLDMEVTATSLDALRTKIAGHLGLIEVEGE